MHQSPPAPFIHFVLFALTLFSAACSDKSDGTPDNDSEPRETEEIEDVVIVDNTGFTIHIARSPVISSVLIATWTFDKGTPTGGAVAFGPDNGYGFAAPSDMDDPQHRTLLLGMKPDSTIHFRIVAAINGIRYMSEDHTATTGHPPTGLPSKTISDLNPTALQGGFLATGSFNGDYAFILDADGDFVWWYNPEGTINDWVRVRFTADAKAMLIANGNVPGPNTGTLVKVSLDGLEETVYPLDLRHHDVTVLPNSDVVTYFEYDKVSGAGTCDRLMEMSPDGSSREVFRIRDHFASRATNSEWCHTNAVNYVPNEDAYYLSVLDFNAILKISRKTGELLWVLGGEDSDFEGASWNAQHQHHVLEDSILIFNNRGEDNNAGFNTSSRALELTLDESRMTAKEKWSYKSGNLSSYAMGDAKRLPNGNTLVVFSSAGVLQEVSTGGDLLREISFGAGGAVGYVEWRPSLYGPPAEYF